jgi:hypothetical protein
MSSEVSSVDWLPEVQPNPSFLVRWSSSRWSSSRCIFLRDYTIYVSDNGGPFTPWLTNTTATEATFTGTSWHTYRFYSIAHNRFGDSEEVGMWPDATTKVADTIKPASRVAALSGTASSPNFQVQWSGADSESGLSDYTVYVSDNGGAYMVWLNQTGATQAWYSGRLGHTYRFFSLARDNSGNTENMKTSAEATTQVPAVIVGDVNGDLRIDCSDVAVVKASLGKKTGQVGFDARADVNKDGVVDIRDLSAVMQKLAPTTNPVSYVSVLPGTASSPNFLVQWSGSDTCSGIRDYTIFVSENGGSFTPWLSQTAATQAWFSGFLSSTYRFFSIARGNDGNQEGMKTVAEATIQVPAVMVGDVNADARIDCSDVAFVKARLGKTVGQLGGDSRADVNRDGVVDIRDLSAVTQKLAPTTKCQ